MIRRDDAKSKSQPATDKISSAEEIKHFFSENVELFNDPTNIMPALLDGRLCLDLIASIASDKNPEITDILDIGCGSGNATVLLLQHLKLLRVLRPNEKLDINITLVDLSPSMLETAVTHVQQYTSGNIEAICADIRDINLPTDNYDAILASMVLHHLRADDQWMSVFRKLHSFLKPAATLWIYDLIESPDLSVHRKVLQRYEEYLVNIQDEAYRDFVLQHMRDEDTPRPLLWQIDHLKKIGFREANILHKHLCYAAFYVTK